jgi:hypothetical protein
MANPIITTLNKIGDTVQDILSGPSQPTPAPTARTSTGQTCLEYTGMRLRRDHLRQNIWRKNDIEYSRPLVLAEYDIQTEFKISTMEEKVQEKEAERQARAAKRQEEKNAKATEKKKKKEEKMIREWAERQKPIEERKGPKELTQQTIDYMNRLENSLLNK